ncbi:acetamidase/formamidase family protein [Sphingosinithalassobacter tenebrarum]|uniref:Acetamidase/formamidase family protein n=1 Tax=Stakelama tenebrarum TaxID=2711215 RepID=A0A6G6YB01_9SPHN|nr:acetamidase/formamidase family protein [Sphingosinithalassobacter tenebrarum]
MDWGYLDASLRPVATVRSGDSVTVSTISGSRAELPTRSDLPVLDRHRAVLDAVSPEMGPHILTGPIAVEGAQPGDSLEVRIEDIALIQRWGYNYTKPLLGALPERFPDRQLYHIDLDPETETGHCPWGTRLPLRPFFGVMAVAPDAAYGRVSTIQPREYGGNIDNRDLVPGSRLFLPVFTEGALFSVGDGHACQGDGEVNLTALETALEGRMTLILHKHRSLALPRATTADDFITMAFCPDLDVAATKALDTMIDAIVACHPITPNEAYALCSLACNLRITQIVDGNKGVHAALPRHLLPGVSDTEFVFGSGATAP